MTNPLIVGFGGATRPNSSSERLVRAVLSACAARGASVRLFDGAMLATLPHFAPEASERTDSQTQFLETIRGAQGLVIGTPAYHGGISGLVKNAIDLCEDTRRDPRSYFDGLPVGLVVSAAGWQAGGVTLTALRSVVHAMRGWPTPVGIAVNTLAQTLFDDQGQLLDDGVHGLVEAQAAQIMRLAC